MVGLIGYALMALGGALELELLRSRGLPPYGSWLLLGGGALIAAWDAHRRDSRMFVVIFVCAIVVGTALWAMQVRWPGLAGLGF